MHPLHVLTPLTGKEASEQRTVIIATVELNARLAKILGVSLVPAVFLSVLAYPLLSEFTILVAPVVMAVAAIFFHRRSNDGLRLHVYQTYMDKWKSKDASTFYLCGEPIDVSEQASVVGTGSVPLSIDDISTLERPMRSSDVGTIHVPAVPDHSVDENLIEDIFAESPRHKPNSSFVMPPAPKVYVPAVTPSTAQVPTSVDDRFDYSSIFN